MSDLDLSTITVTRRLADDGLIARACPECEESQ